MPPAGNAPPQFLQDASDVGANRGRCDVGGSSNRVDIRASVEKAHDLELAIGETADSCEFFGAQPDALYERGLVVCRPSGVGVDRGLQLIEQGCEWQLRVEHGVGARCEPPRIMELPLLRSPTRTDPSSAESSFTCQSTPPSGRRTSALP